MRAAPAPTSACSILPSRQRRLCADEPRRSFHIAGENSFDLGSGLDGSESDLVGAIVVQPWDEIAFSYQARVEEDLSDINVQEAFASFTVDRFSGSLGYIYLDSEPSAPPGGAGTMTRTVRKG